MSISNLSTQDSQQNSNGTSTTALAAGAGIGVIGLLGAGLAIHGSRKQGVQPSPLAPPAQSASARESISGDSIASPAPQSLSREQTVPPAYTSIDAETTAAILPQQQVPNIKRAGSYSARPLVRANGTQLRSLDYLDLAGTSGMPTRNSRSVHEAPASLPSATFDRASEFSRAHNAILSQPAVRDLQDVQQSLSELHSIRPQQLAGILKDNLSTNQLSSGKDGTAFALKEYPALIGRATTKHIQDYLNVDFCKSGGVVALPVHYDKRLSPVGNDSTFGVPHAVVLPADDPHVRDGFVNAEDVDFENPAVRVLAWLMPNCAGFHPMKQNAELEEKRCSVATLGAIRSSVKNELTAWEQSLTPKQQRIFASAKMNEDRLHEQLKIHDGDLPEGRYLLEQCRDSLSQDERALLEHRDIITKPLRTAKAMRKFNYGYLYAGGLSGLFPDDLLNGKSIASLDAQEHGNRFRAVAKEFAKGECIFHANPSSSVLYRTFFSSDAGKAIADWHKKMSSEYAEELAKMAGMPQSAYDRLAGSMAILHQSQSPVSLDFEHTNNMFVKAKHFRLIDLAIDKNRRTAPNDTTDLLKVLLHGCFVSPLRTIAEPDEARVRASAQTITDKISVAANTYKLELPDPERIYGFNKLGLVR